MKILIAVVAVAAVVSGILFFSRSDMQPQASPALSPSPTSSAADITASFTIVTDKITRSFKAEKYHNQSGEVFITGQDPTMIHVKKTGTTWADFFETLPMELTKECLITGDGERLCDRQNGTLKFYLNDIEDKDALDKEIKQDDKLLVRFSS